MVKVEIIIPKGATTNIENGLVELTKILSKKLKVELDYGLGGEFGYGIEFANGVFMMHPFCWCDQEDCGWCKGVLPNFLFKPTNCKIFWYKWIGRSQEQKGKMPKDWLEICKKSIKE